MGLDLIFAVYFIMFLVIVLKMQLLIFFGGPISKCISNGMGVLMCVTLWQDIVNEICDDDDIKAVSFVGSNTVSTLKSFSNLNSKA